MKSVGFAVGWFGLLPATAGGWWEGGFAVKAALSVWLAYAVIDVGVLLTAGLTPRVAVLFAVSFRTKLAAACSGAWVAGRRA